jgi:gamma-glutamyl phosphate reductase
VKKEKVSNAHETMRELVVKEAFGKRFVTNVVNKVGEEPVKVNAKDEQIEVLGKSKIFARRKKEHRILLTDVLIAFEAALRSSEGDPDELRRLFLKYLNLIPK